MLPDSGQNPKFDTCQLQYSAKQKWQRELIQQWSTQWLEQTICQVEKEDIIPGSKWHTSSQRVPFRSSLSHGAVTNITFSEDQLLTDGSSAAPRLRTQKKSQRSHLPHLCAIMWFAITHHRSSNSYQPVLHLDQSCQTYIVHSSCSSIKVRT